MRENDSLVVRRLSPQDVPFIRATAREAFAEYDGDVAGERTLAMVLEPGSFALVADLAGQPAAFAVVTVKGPHAHLNVIAVSSKVRGRGIGRRILRAIELLASGRGAKVVALETGEANLAAIDLFQRAGYVRQARLPRYYRSGYDALLFLKTL